MLSKAALQKNLKEINAQRRNKDGSSYKNTREKYISLKN